MACEEERIVNSFRGICGTKQSALFENRCPNLEIELKMATVAQTILNEPLLDELREMARGGKTCEQLVDHIRESLYLPSDAMVPVLAYICRGFSIPLPIVLPLREDEGKGTFGRAINIPIWFVALMTENVTSDGWEWRQFCDDFGDRFDFESMVPVMIGEATRWTKPWIRQIAIPGGPWYLRGLFEAYVDKSYGLNFDYFATVQRFATVYQNELAKCGFLSPLRTKMDFQLEEQGPIYRVVCMVQAIRSFHP